MDKYKTQHGYLVQQATLTPIEIEPIPISSVQNQTRKRRERSPDPYFIPLSLIIVLLMSIIGIQVSLFAKDQWDKWEYQDYQNTKLELQRIKTCIK